MAAGATTVAGAPLSTSRPRRSSTTAPNIIDISHPQTNQDSVLVVVVQPNGSRLSCGRSCAGATNAERERMQVGDQHSDSPTTINARQLQALVRLTLPRSHRHGLIFRGAAQGGHRRRAARAPVRPGRHLPCGNLAGPSPRLRLAPRHRAPAEPGPAPNVIDDRHPQTNRIGIDLDGSA